MSNILRASLLAFCLLCFSNCTSLSYHRSNPPLNEYKRASNPAFLSTVNNTPNVASEEMDRDLSRRHWIPAEDSTEGDYRYEAVITPITAPLIDRLFREEALVKNLPMTEVQKATNNMTRALVEDQACFEVFVKAPTLLGQESQVDYYSITYQNDGEKPNLAVPLLEKRKYSSVATAARELLDTHLPTTIWDEQLRNIKGLGSYSRQLLCGKTIDFQKTFHVSLQPRYDLSLAKRVLTWETSISAE